MSETTKLVSWNVNGLRSVATKGFLEWLGKEKPDVLCLQEIKVMDHQLEEEVRAPKGYKAIFQSAKKPGYSGVAIYSRVEPLKVTAGIGLPGSDDEGRVLTAEYKDYTVVNAYFPNSQRDHARLPFKLEFCEAMYKHLESIRKQGKHVLLCGDLNIAHKEIDLKNPKTNKDNAGFLPEERAWLDFLIDEKGYIDTFRMFDAGPENYTWWSYRPGVREKNVGWRLDYFLVNPEAKAHIKAAKIHCEVMGSDHCPVSVTFRP